MGKGKKKMNKKQIREETAIGPPWDAAYEMAEALDTGEKLVVIRRAKFPETSMFRWDATEWKVIRWPAPCVLVRVGFGVTKRGALRSMSKMKEDHRGFGG